FTVRCAYGEVERALECFFWESGPVVVNGNPRGISLYLNHRGYVRFLTRIQRVVEELFGDHQRPLLDSVTRLCRQLFLAEEIHLPGGLNLLARGFPIRRAVMGSRWGSAGLSAPMPFCGTSHMN